MSGVRLTGDWGRFEKALNSIANPDFKKPLKETGVYMLGAVEERFAEETGPDGTKWIPSQRALKEDGQTLTDTRHLRNNIQTEGFILDGDVAVEIGTNIEYGPTHQFGEETGSGGGIPARPFMGFSPDDEAEIEEIFMNWLGGLIK